MTKSSDFNLEVDELSAAIQAQLVLYSIPAPASTASVKTDKAKSPPKKVEKNSKELKSATASSSVNKEEKKEKFDRWSVAPTESIEYGYLSASPNINKSTESQSTKYYLTTAINYTNGPAHMGHAYEATTADCLSRFARLQYGSENAYFVTGADEHGQKIANTAEADGKQPIEICNKYVTGFQCLNQRILITNNDYVRTTSSRHKRTAQALWKKCAANDDIYLSKYSGWYNIREETFVTDSDAALSDYKDPTSGLPLKKVEEESYFFRMASYHDRLVKHIENNPEFIQPESHRNAILARLNGDKLRDLSISRTTFNWGIQVPEGFDQNHVMYVWFDALSNYLTGVNGLGVNHEDDESNTADNALASYWPSDVHIIGKDILWFHTVIWPCILFSAGIPLPKTVFAHGFVNDKEGKKMSKSMGNVVDPHDMLDKYSVDTFRWYLCKEAPYGGELSFSEDSLMDMHNSDLADTLGNLVHRATNLCGKYCGGVVPDVLTTETAVSDFNAYRNEYITKMNSFELENGASIAMKAFREVNGFLTDKAPWHIKGKDDESVKARQLIVRAVLEAVYALAHLLMPFLPNGSKAIFTKLNTKPKNTLAEVDSSLMNLNVGTKIDVGDILYSKIISEDEKNAAEASKKKAEAYAEAQKRKKEKKQKEIAASKAGQKSSKAGSADQPDFTKMEIRVGQITKVWYHTEADKLFCEEIDVGEENKRQIASGLREHYTLEQMDGRKVLVVCNLKAAKIVGFTSNGMVLAAKSDDGTKVELVDPPSDATIGEQVYIEGLTGYDPLSSAQVKKKKVWDLVSKKLRTGDGGVAKWDGKEILTSKGVCSAASLVDAPIS